jgi:hypothetical protein
MLVAFVIIKGTFLTSLPIQSALLSGRVSRVCLMGPEVMVR